MSETIDIDYVAKLARLDLSDEEKQTFSKQLEKVFEYCERIREVDVSGIEPTSHAYPVYNVWQEDHPAYCFPQETALANAPEIRNQQIVVPKIVE